MITPDRSLLERQTSESHARDLPKSSVAVRLDNVTKVYRLYGNPGDQVLDVLGLNRFFRRGRTNFQEFNALKGVTLKVGRGERVGIVGRNGAGKTTLLKLMTGNFAASSGTVEVNGSVQALMQMGLGFHPEFSGYENIKAALNYNGLTGKEYEVALSEVIEFVELGEFLHHPMKTYSAGMCARLQFAAATAINPDILIIDEVLGAGDAYFSGKCAYRMEKLALSGTTLLLVSHSMQQIIQFCERAVWMEGGSIVLSGETLKVVKAYEEYIQRLENARKVAEAEDNGGGAADGESTAGSCSVLSNRWLRERLLEQVLGGQQKQMKPHDSLDQVAMTSGGVSRWEGAEKSLKISAVRVVDQAGVPISIVRTGDPANIEIDILAKEEGIFPCYMHVLLFTEDGRWLSRHCSERYDLSLRSGEIYTIRLSYERILLGNGKYIFTAGIYRTLDLTNLRTARFYDLLSRSFELTVVGPYRDDDSIFYHPATWQVVDIHGEIS